ncbi:MAG: hypothetical protein CVT48_06520 [Thermoplasmata archaeon HGW-Thermoplasmata-1]|nr:MAG: hypothetical protein CVT48_06520 [Thermoplasmata archaeon HGW-Thermoplasmata-1]
MIEALDHVKNQPGFAEATVVVYLVMHGGCLPTLPNYPTDGKVHAGIEICAEDNKELPSDDRDWKDYIMYDYELKEMLDGFNPAKFLFITVACESGVMAGQDTAGAFAGASDSLFDSLGAPGRIVITGSTTPLMTSGDVLGHGFWEKGIKEGRGDTAPTGNGDGETSVEEAFYYCKSLANADGTETASSQPCMNDQYEGEMIL